MKEYEYKFLVDYNIFNSIKNKVIKKSKKIKNVIQINYYYDTNDFYFNKNYITYRIRQINNNLTLEKKEKLKNNNFILSEESYKKQLSYLPKKIFDKNIRQYIFLKGCLVTKRNTYIFENYGFELSFDENYYLGILDYEIELEFNPNICTNPSFYLNNLKLNNFKKNKIGKSERFFTIFVAMNK